MARVKAKQVEETVEADHENCEVKINDPDSAERLPSVEKESQESVIPADKEQGDIEVVQKNKETPKIIKETNEREKVEEENTSESEIPDEVKRVLKRFHKEPELYVDKCGGVYSKDTQHHLVKNAILYKNPFYNK